jgi:hypothetical protein
MPNACMLPVLAREVSCVFLRSTLQQGPRARPFAASLRSKTVAVIVFMVLFEYCDHYKRL